MGLAQTATYGSSPRQREARVVQSTVPCTEHFVWRGEDARPHPNQSIAQLALERLKKHSREATSPAQVSAATGSEMSFSELLLRSVHSAEAWRTAGLGPGSVLAVFAKNTEDLFPAVIGALFQGVTFTAVNHLATEAQLRHYLSLVQPDAVLCDASNVDMALRVAAKCLIVVQDGPAPTGSQARTLDEVLAAAATDLDVHAYKPADVGNLRDHVAALIFTSGSMGPPKAVMISNYAAVQTCIDGFDATHTAYNERMMVSSPMSWISGFGMLLRCTLSGMTRICDNFTSPAALLANLRKHQAHCWLTSAPLLVMVAEVAKAEGYDGSLSPCPSLQSIILGGTTVLPALEEAMSRTFHCDIFQVYASTEMLSCSMSKKPLRPGSAGQLVGGIHARLLDQNTGADIRVPGQAGELMIYSDYLMLGYKGDPKATAQAFDEHGYFRTGDLAFFDKDGYLFVLGRIKEQLKFKEQHVLPTEVESVLLSHPAVAEVCVVGRPHPKCGHAIAACVVRSSCREEVTENELHELVALRLSDAKRLRGGIVFTEQIPKLYNGKVARREVLALLEGVPMQDVD